MVKLQHGIAGTTRGFASSGGLSDSELLAVPRDKGSRSTIARSNVDRGHDKGIPISQCRFCHGRELGFLYPIVILLKKYAEFTLHFLGLVLQIFTPSICHRDKPNLQIFLLIPARIPWAKPTMSSAFE